MDGRRTAVALAGCLLAGCAGGAERVRERPTLDEAIADGVAYLVRSQNRDGSWGNLGEIKGWEYGMDSIPGALYAFRDATTALAVMALREEGEREASARGLDYLVNRAYARRTLKWELYNIWAHAFGLQCLALALKDAPDDAGLRRAAERELRLLATFESHVGGWNYYDFEVGAKRPAGDPTSFTTAAALVALREAREAGLDVPEPLVRRALRRMAEMRLPDGSWAYSWDGRWRPVAEHNRIQGAIGRTQAANFAMRRWGHPSVGEEDERRGLELFFRYHGYLEIGRKRQWPHEAWYATAPYYFFFGHYYAGRLAERRPEIRRRLSATILPFQEPDGSWWDYPLYGYTRPYGTALAVMALRRCRP